jgi:two-component system, OmpR family, KDP operon response regulator KdpE
MTKVLIVDDEVRILNFTGVALKAAGYEVVTAVSGEQALDLAKQELPDVILLDVFMPGLDGIQVLKRLRGVSQAPVIVLSARSAVKEVALAAGASDFLPKPYIPDELVKRIKSALSPGP